ncbi:class I SAM-dependent methyltransferase [Heyndrickxia sp. MSNUG]|uniref:class I SAM-dependent methyltransferase n=1 Tax=Heyndrickxia sp. MSNUG TaxID=3136677 RepID=UPI003C2B9B6A
MELLNRLKEYIDSQYRLPTGAIGSYIGEKMVRQHQPETIWTLELLEFKKEEMILELGCGAGYAIKKILKNDSVEYIIGLDLSETVLKSARMRNRHEINKGRARLVQGNVKQLPFENQQFTRVFSIQSIYFWDQIEETLSEIYRVLIHEGKMVLTLSNGKAGIMWNGINEMVENEVIPHMKKIGFKNIETVRGPDSRQYHTIAIIGEK